MPFISSIRGNYSVIGRGRAGVGPDLKALITGGTITTAGGYRIHTFLNTDPAPSKTFDTTSYGSTLSVEYLVIAGGGGGAGPAGACGVGGGGAGGYQTSSLSVPATSYPIVIGGGGAGGSGQNPVGNGALGENSSFSSITSIGGGGGSGSATTS